MNIKVVRVIVHEVLDQNGAIVDYTYVRNEIITGVFKQCAMSRAYESAMSLGTLNSNDLGQLSFVNENLEMVFAGDKMRNAINKFFSLYPYIYPLCAPQHMTEVGKMLVAKKPVDQMLSALFSESFAQRMDTNSWQKIAQIACQPGRLLEEKPKFFMGNRITQVRAIGRFQCNGYIDESRESEDGIIFVSPNYWSTILAAYSLPDRMLPEDTTLIKVNSVTQYYSIKALLQKASNQKWNELIARTGRNDFSIFVCGNAIKDNDGSLVQGQVYTFDETSFAYHSDSMPDHRNRYVNVSKQLMTRSGMDTAYFIEQASGPAIKQVAGLMKFDLDTVLTAIGQEQEPGKELLESVSAIQRNITEHNLPPNHPVNVYQIYRLAMSKIKSGLARINVPGFHNMGGVSNGPRGVVYVPYHIYKNWKIDHGSNEAYLFRNPFLGAYCGRIVRLLPTDTDTLLVNWEDALQFEGDFDGDQYYIAPTTYIRNTSIAEKPERPAKGKKSIVPLDTENLLEAIIIQANNKADLGRRDSYLSLAFDNLYEASNREDAEDIDRWQRNISLLQVHFQQGVEGLKHGAKAILTDKQVYQMFRGYRAHFYTQLFSNSMMNDKLFSTRTSKGYIDKVKMVARDEYNGHPLHGIFNQLKDLEFGDVDQLHGWYDSIKDQKVTCIKQPQRSVIYRTLREMLSTYAKGVTAWNGGKNKHIRFGPDILEPLREQWNLILEPYIDKEDCIRDLHLMLAQVAYEPQPNWNIVGKNVYRGLGLFTRMNRQDSFCNFCKTGEEHLHNPKWFIRTGSFKHIQVLKIKRDPRSILVDWKEKYRVGRFTFSIRMWLPKTGNLLHHLAIDGKYVIDVLGSVLPKRIAKI